MFILITLYSATVGPARKLFTLFIIANASKAISCQERDCFTGVRNDTEYEGHKGQRDQSLCPLCLNSENLLYYSMVQIESGRRTNKAAVSNTLKVWFILAAPI